MILGFGLKYRELSESEQEKAVAVIRSELLANYETLKELGKNTSTILGAIQVRQRLGSSERRACRTISVARSTQRYKASSGVSTIQKCCRFRKAEMKQAAVHSVRRLI